MESLDKLPAPVLTLAQQKKSIGGLKKVQKRKVIHTLDSPLDIQWYPLNHLIIELNFIDHLLENYCSGLKSGTSARIESGWCWASKLALISRVQMSCDWIIVSSDI